MAMIDMQIRPIATTGQFFRLDATQGASTALFGK
jgi:hypothetical protein